MPRIDDYNQAVEIGKGKLSGKDPDLLADFSGAGIYSDKQRNVLLSLNFLNREITISWPDLAFSYRGSDEEVPIQQQVLLLHYFSGAWSSKGVSITGEWIGFQDVPDGKFYLDAFLRRAKDPLLGAFGAHPQVLMEMATEAYGAAPLDYGDFSVVVKALPLVPIALILWKGDEEFPPDGNILFDKNTGKIFSAEDIAWLAGMVVYPLIGMAKAKGQG